MTQSLRLLSSTEDWTRPGIENITWNITLNLEESFTMKALGFTDKFPLLVHEILETVTTFDASITEVTGF